MRCFVFRLKGRFGHFRKFYTTASALSYDFPPPTTIRGLVGAIVGLGREECIRKTAALGVGIVVEALEDRFFAGLNLINIKHLKKEGGSLTYQRTQANRQLLLNPSYLIYLCGEGEVYENFAQKVQNSETYFTPYLGKTSYMADIEPVNSLEAEPEDQSDSAVGVLPLECVSDFIGIAKQGKIHKDRIPVSFEEKRVKPRYKDVVYLIGHQSMKGDFRGLYRVGDDYLYIFTS